MKKVILLGGANVIHTTRWANGLVQAGLDVVLVSMCEPIHYLEGNIKFRKLSFSAPLGYFIAVKELRRIMAEERPDLMNVHYASGYGTLAALTGYKKILLSIWGSDVYDFPSASLLHKLIISNNLRRAKAIASTSHAMLRRSQKIFEHKSTFITPFGIDIDNFKGRKIFPNKRKIVIGTVKTLDYKYGIDTLIEAFSIIKKRSIDSEVELVIAGEGPDLNKLLSLAKKLNLSDSVRFLGRIPHDEVPKILNSMDIYVALSRLDSESFGVAILEAGACELPVVVSDVDGPAEVVINNVTGLIVPRNSPVEAADAVLKLIKNEELRKSMGRSARKHVIQNYEWAYCVRKMLDAFEFVAE